MKSSIRTRLPVNQTWHLVADLQAQQEWLGRGAYLDARKGSRARLQDTAGFWRTGSVTAVRLNKRIVCRLAPSASWPEGHAPTQLTISLEAHKAGGSVVTVEESGLSSDIGEPTPLQDATDFWEGALQRLQNLAGQIVRRKNSPRQAVIIIHGIGEQQPGVTLRKFVEGLLGSINAEIQSWSKPDRMSPLFELRQITLKAGKGQRRPTTEIFELYWAHLIRDTTLSQVASWLRHLLLRRRVPSRFVPVWLFGWLAVAGILVFLVTGYRPAWVAYLMSGGLAVVLLTLVWRVLGKSFVLNSLGDAARYLTPRPANIEHRQAIREAGVDLLETLESTGRYDRIVIVGHSLGSVIAYDVLSQFWIRTHRKHLRLPKVSNAGVTAVETALDETDIDETQKLQHDAWQTLRANGQPWLITDLVTLGSPLSAADFLMAPTLAEFQRAKDNRELPTCPPVFEIRGADKRVSFDLGYEDRFGGKDKTFRYLDHAAVFAVTRWTNLHFGNSLLKDPIGGPIAPQFGHWVRDVELAAPKGRPFFLHSCYWRAKGNKKNIEVLLDALGLESGEELLASMRQHSPLLYLRNFGRRPT